MSQAQLNFSVTLRSISCYKCTAIFAISAEYDDRLQREPGRTFWCPICGVSQVYRGKSWEQELADARAATEKAKREGEEKLASQVKRTQWAQEAARKNERVARAQRGLVTRLKNRVAKGACPCCGKVFPDMATHMTEKHPDYADFNPGP